MQVHSSSAPHRLSRARTAAYTAGAVALPILAFLAVELALRLAGVASERREPFQPVPGQRSHVALDPDYGAMYFRGFRPGVAFDPMRSRTDDATRSGADDATRSGADDDVIRIVALGGSTTAGFPYHWYYGFPARLEDRLAAALPGRVIEVANLGLTATNSFTVRDFAGAVEALRPDAVVVYSGHNEYYGAYGTAGTQGWTGTSVRLKRLLIGASRWAVVAGIGGFFEPDDAAAGERRTMMARVVREASIDADSDVYRAGVAQFEANLRDALRRLERADIPVFLGTLTSNLADQAPLGDEPAARAAYDRGIERLAAGDTSDARGAFVEAKEADGLRFRAPEAMNEAVRRLAAEFAHVTLVDVQERFRSESPGGLEGAALFADHLHPNARGYALMADAYFDAMRTGLAPLRDAAEPGPTPYVLDPLEERLSEMQIKVLTSGYPFRKDRSPAEAEAAVRADAAAMARSSRYADELAAKAISDGASMANLLDAAVDRAQAASDTLAVLRLYGALLHWQPFNESLMERAVGYALPDPAYDDETAALARYAANHANKPFSMNALAAIALRQGDLERADALLEAVERIDHTSPEMLFNRARLLVLQGDTLAARKYFERYRATSAPASDTAGAVR